MNILMSIKINYLKIKDELRRIRESGVRDRERQRQGIKMVVLLEAIYDLNIQMVSPIK